MAICVTLLCLQVEITIAEEVSLKTLLASGKPNTSKQERDTVICYSLVMPMQAYVYINEVQRLSVEGPSKY